MKKYIVDVDITISCRICVNAESKEQAKTIVGNWIGDNPWQYVRDGHYISHEFEAVNECNPEDEPDYEAINEPEEEEPSDAKEKLLEQWSMTFKGGVLYARSQMEQWELDIIRAKVDRNYAQHDAPSTGIDDHRIIDLLEEYGEDNDLPEGWYLDEYDADDVMLMI